MQIYRHVLAAVDLGPADRHIVARAAAIAQAAQAQLTLLHVVRPLLPDPGSELMLDPGFALQQPLLDSARQELDLLAREIAAQLAAEPDRPPAVATHVELGSTREVVTSFAQERGVDLIVVGSHDRHGLALLFGSTADAILHHAPCDVLAVRVAQ